MRVRATMGYAETSLKNKDEPMADKIGVIAMGEMGSGVARRLHERGATVITQLTGRSAASAARAERAGAIPVATDEEFVRQADFILSIVPPCDPVALPQPLPPALQPPPPKTPTLSSH